MVPNVTESLIVAAVSYSKLDPVDFGFVSLTEACKEKM
jgi:hypothetical protein